MTATLARHFTPKPISKQGSTSVIVDKYRVAVPWPERKVAGARLAKSVACYSLHLRLALASLLLTPMNAIALSPLTPRLDEASRIDLFQKLITAGIPEVGGSAVLVSLLAVLGTAPATREHRYREPYPQLPDVDAASIPTERSCAKIAIAARLKGATRPEVRIEGVYCLLDPLIYEWGSQSVSVN